LRVHLKSNSKHTKPMLWCRDVFPWMCLGQHLFCLHMQNKLKNLCLLYFFPQRHLFKKKSSNINQRVWNNLKNRTPRFIQYKGSKILLFLGSFSKSMIEEMFSCSRTADNYSILQAYCFDFEKSKNVFNFVRALTFVFWKRYWN